MRRRRKATSALEVLFASALLVMAFVPIMGLLQQSHVIATLDELQVLARHRVAGAAARHQGWTLETWRQRAQGGPPPPGVDPRLSAQSRAVPWEEPGASELPDPLARRLAGMTLEVYFEELEVGLARVAYLVRWSDPATRVTRRFVWVRFHEDPDLGRSRS